MNVRFDEQTHTYYLGDKKLISVTQLLKKHGLSTNYAGVDAAVLNKAAEKGTLIHKEIEDYIKTGEVGFTSELSDFISICDEAGFIPEDSEVILPSHDIPEDEVDNYIVAGTADIIGHRGEALVLVDTKTTYAVNKRAGAWQLSLYERLAGVHFDEMYILHLGANSKLIPIERIPATEVDRLLECERKGELYQEPGLAVPGELALRVQEAEHALIEAETTAKAAKAAADELRAELYDIMEQQGYLSWETPDKTLLVSRVAPTTKTSIDSKRLKAEMPDIAEKYKTTSTVKGYIKITIRSDD